MLKTWTLSLSLLVAALAGCGGTKKGTVPVDAPIYQPPPNDPSAEEAEESDDADSTDGEGGESRAPSKPVNTAGVRGHSSTK